MPKTGGTFIKHWFDANGIELYNQGHACLEHRGHARWWFATVRNPYHRMASWYEFFRHKAERELARNRRPPDRYHRMLDIYHRGFRYFLEHGNDAIGYLHRTQAEWIEGVDRVIKLEELYQQWHHVCDRANSQAELPAHSAKTQDASSYYDNYTRQLVQDIYGKDFEQFGYDRDEI